ncbi:hypothetical protein BGZ76_001547, partial [Entomortierella beljakovae]
TSESEIWFKTNTNEATTHFTGIIAPTPANSSSSAISATPTASSTDESKSSILPIVLGSVIGIVVLIAIAVFFYIWIRKNRRYSSREPLGFMAVSLDDGSDAAPGSDAVNATNSRASFTHSLPVMSGILGSKNRNSYQSSEYSGSTAAQFAQWSQDDENASLVGGTSMQQRVKQDDTAYPPRLPGGILSQEHDLISNDGSQRPRSILNQPFVASSMIPLAPNDPLTARYSRQQQQSNLGLEQQENIITRSVPSGPPIIRSPMVVPIQPLVAIGGSNSPRSRPLSVHSTASSEHQEYVKLRPISVHSVASSTYSNDPERLGPSGQSNRYPSMRSVRTTGSHVSSNQDDRELQYL